MSEQKKNPIIAGLISLIPTAITTITSLIKDKKEAKAEPKSETGNEIINSVKDMVSGNISSKRVLNLVGTGLIISIAITDITAHGITKLNLALIIIGVCYSLGMSFLTMKSEK